VNDWKVITSITDQKGKKTLGKEKKGKERKLQTSVSEVKESGE
jgi:hypothetical protein